MPAAFADFCEGFYAFPILGMLTFAAGKAVFPLIMGQVGFAFFRGLEGIGELD